MEEATSLEPEKEESGSSGRKVKGWPPDRKEGKQSKEGNDTGGGLSRQEKNPTSRPRGKVGKEPRVSLFPRE